MAHREEELAGALSEALLMPCLVRLMLAVGGTKVEETLTRGRSYRIRLLAVAVPLYPARPSVALVMASVLVLEICVCRS